MKYRLARCLYGVRECEHREREDGEGVTVPWRVRETRGARVGATVGAYMAGVAHARVNTTYSLFSRVCACVLGARQREKDHGEWEKEMKLRSRAVCTNRVYQRRSNTERQPVVPESQRRDRIGGVKEISENLLEKLVS